MDRIVAGGDSGAKLGTNHTIFPSPYLSVAWPEKRLLITHFHEVCAKHAANSELRYASQYDLVLASCGGFPKDINFIQSLKRIHNNAAWVRYGGHLILLAHCRDQIRSDTFLPWFDHRNWGTAFSKLLASYQGNFGTALAMLPSLAPEVMQKRGITPISKARIKECIDAQSSPMAVVPNASFVVKKQLTHDA